MRKNPRRILSPQRLPFRHPGKWQYKSNERIDLLQHWGESRKAILLLPGPGRRRRAALRVTPLDGIQARRVIKRTSMQNKIRVLGVSCYVLLHGWANDVDLEVVLSGESESGFGQGRRKAHMAQVFGDFRMVQGQNISGQRVIERGDFAVALDFEAARRDLLRRSRLAIKDLPHNCWMYPCNAELLAKAYAILSGRPPARCLDISRRDVTLSAFRLCRRNADTRVF